MRRAPPVAVACNTGLRWSVAQAVLTAAASAVAVAWLSRLAGSTPALAGALALAAALGTGLATGRWQRPQPLELRWDGEQWRLGDEPGTVAVMLDLDRWLLLRWRAGAPGPAVHWLALEAGARPALWHAVRAALYSAAAPESPRPTERQNA